MLFKKKNNDIAETEIEKTPSKVKGIKKESKNGYSKAELKKQLKYGSLSIVLTAVVIAVIVVLNILVSAIAEKIPELSIDTSARGYYELTDESKNYVKNLKDYDIDIIFIGSEQNLLTDQYYSKILPLARKYAQYSSCIEVSCVDIDKTPGFASKYDDIELSEGDAIIACGERYRMLTSADFLYTEDEENSSTDSYYSEEETPDYSLTAEYALTTSIMVVTASDNPKATFITGHGEKELEKLETLLYRNGFETKSQSLIKEIDEDCNLLVMVAPTKDYSEEDLQKIDTFLENGGNYGKNFMYIADYSQPVLPNLEAFMADWGFEIGEGVVYESDENVAYANMPYLNKLSFIDPKLTLQSALSDVTAFGYYGRPTKISKTLGNFMVNTIALEHTATSKVGRIVDGEFVKDEGEGYNYVAMGYTCYEKVALDLTYLRSNVLYVNSVGFFEDELFDKNYSANPDITIAMIDELLGRGNNLIIPSKSLAAASLGITYNAANTIGVIAAAVIPLALLVVCIVVYVRRRFL